MPTITYTRTYGDDETVDVADGTTVMRAALLNGVSGIIGECGGQAMCATCHVYVESVIGELPVIGADEDEMLDCTASPRLEQSRLGCQLRAGGFSAITVRLPSRQV